MMTILAMVISCFGQSLLAVQKHHWGKNYGHNQTILDQPSSNPYIALGEEVGNSEITLHLRHDIMNRVVEINADPTHPSLQYSHAPEQFKFTYDNLGRRTSAEVINGNGTEIYSDSWTFDDRGRLTGHNSTNGNLSYTYNNNNNLVEAQSNTAAGFHQRYQYDVLNRIEHVHYGQEGSATDVHLASYRYNAVGSMTEVAYLNQVNHVYQFDTLNRLTNLEVKKVGATEAEDVTQHHYKYTLNDSGHRTKIEELHSGRTINNTFDDLYRLTYESISGGTVNGSVSYTYDKVSNRKTRGSTLAGVTNQTHNHTANDWLGHHTYDDNGSTTQSPDLVNGTGNTNDVYDFRNKLIRRTSDSGDTINLYYNADGHRVKKEIVTGGVLQIAGKVVNYLVDNNNPTGYSQVVEEKNGNDILEKVNHYGHARIGFDDKLNSGERRFYSLDGHGSVRGLTDDTGEVKEEYDFDAYGILIGFRQDDGSGLVDQAVESIGVLSRNTYLFAGEEWDADMGMYYNRARYYDVENGRFNAMDSWEGTKFEPITLNKYLYTNGNPVSGVDPTGYFTMTEVQVATSIQKNMQRVNFSKRVAKGLNSTYRVLVQLFVLNNMRLALFGSDTQLKKAATKAVPYNAKLLKNFRKLPISKTMRAAITKLPQLGLTIAANRSQGVPIKEDNGMPDFRAYRHVKKPVVFIRKLRGNRREDFKVSNRIRNNIPLGVYRGKATPKGYTWHHHEVLGVMELVDSKKHRQYHFGGVFVYKMLTNNKPVNGRRYK